MFEIKPNALYSREDLERELEGIMDVETFLQRIRPRKRYKSAWWGQDLIDALNGPLEEERMAARRRCVASRRGLSARQNRPTRPPGLEPIKLSGERGRRS